MKFMKTAPSQKNLDMGKGWFLVNTGNAEIAKLLSQNVVQSHSDIIQKKCASLTGQNLSGLTGDVVAVFDKSEPDDEGWTRVYFHYYVI